MKIQDARGQALEEVTLRFNSEEITELLVAASQIEDGSMDHALIRDRSGLTVGIYSLSDDDEPLERHMDWWVGPVLLLLVILLGAGAFTLARGVISLLF